MKDLRSELRLRPERNKFGSLMSLINVTNVANNLGLNQSSLMYSYSSVNRTTLISGVKGIGTHYAYYNPSPFDRLLR